MLNIADDVEAEAGAGFCPLVILFGEIGADDADEPPAAANRTLGSTLEWVYGA